MRSDLKLPTPVKVSRLLDGGTALHFQVDKPGGGPVQIQILEMFETLREYFSAQPQVVEFTRSIIPWEEIDDNDKVEQCRFLTHFVKANVRYVRDPSAFEFVRSPVQRLIPEIIRDGVTNGDCDDHAMLLNTLLGAVGIDSRFVGVKLRSPKFNHVISAAWLPDPSTKEERWVNIDTCANKRPDRARPPRQYTETLTVKE